MRYTALCRFPLNNQSRVPATISLPESHAMSLGVFKLEVAAQPTCSNESAFCRPARPTGAGLAGKHGSSHASSGRKINKTHGPAVRKPLCPHSCLSLGGQLLPNSSSSAQLGTPKVLGRPGSNTARLVLPRRTKYRTVQGQQVQSRSV